jgi:hypothetical protein
MDAWNMQSLPGKSWLGAFENYLNIRSIKKQAASSGQREEASGGAYLKKVN